MVTRLKYTVAGALAALLALELLLQLLPVSSATQSGYYISPKILTYPAHHRWTVSTGWDLRNAQQLSSNNFGFVADHDFLPGSHAVALIGDSFVEASMLPARDRPAAQLERLLGGRPVYAMGGPGSSLLDYAERLRWARQQLGIEDFVLFLSHSDAVEAWCGSGNVHSECLDRQTLEPKSIPLPPAGALKSVLRHSALAQYLVGQIKLSADRLLQPGFWSPGVPHPAPAEISPGPAAQAKPIPPPALDKVIDAFEARLDPALRSRMVVLVHMDHQRLQLRPIGQAQAPSGPLPAGNEFLVGQLRARGYRVVDAAEVFRPHLAHSTLGLNVGPYDGHLNALGLGQLMAAVAARMQEP